MNQQKPIQYLTAFFLGALLGLGLDLVIRWIYNAICTYSGCALMDFTWWNVFPLPLLMGLALAINVARYPLAD